MNWIDACDVDRHTRVLLLLLCLLCWFLFSPFLRVIAAGGTITTEYRVVLARWFCSTHNESQRSMLAEKHRNVMLMCHRHYKYLQTTSRE